MKSALRVFAYAALVAALGFGFAITAHANGPSVGQASPSLSALV